MSMAALRFAEHKAFLRLVHSAPGGGDELYLGRALPAPSSAILSSGCRWSPARAAARAANVSSHPSMSRGCGTSTVSRRRRYAAYCTERFGRVLDPTTAAFQAQSEAAEADAASAEGETRRLWRALWRRGVLPAAWRG